MQTKTELISKVIEKMHKKGRITKKDVRDILDVSVSDASKYLEELERLGVLNKKKSKTGRVSYVFDRKTIDL